MPKGRFSTRSASGLVQTELCNANPGRGNTSEIGHRHHIPTVITLPEGLPALIENAGDKTAWHFIEFFTATIRNANTREAYARAMARFLSRCVGGSGVTAASMPQGAAAV